MSSRIAAIILAAGKGTRLKTDVPKVLHEVCGRPMLAYVFDACRDAGITDCIAVVGYGKEMVRDAFASDRSSAGVSEGQDRQPMTLQWVEQNQQLGTGHAVMMAHEHLSRYDQIVVLCGDGPLIRAETIRDLVDTHKREGAAATLATAILDDPTGYGRIQRDERGTFLGIVEHGDATQQQRAIREINPSYYCFDSRKLASCLDQLKPNNVKNEYYITDVFSLLLQQGEKVFAVTSVPPEDIFSINSRADLALVNRVMRDRVLKSLMNAGVTIVDPATTWIDSRARIGQDTIVYPNVYVHGPVSIGARCRVGPFAALYGELSLRDGTILPPFQELRA